MKNGKSTYDKIFGIGLSRTGTTSLHYAVTILGYRSRHYVPELFEGLAQFDSLNNYQAFFDTPVPAMYRELSKKYPKALFILTTRPVDSWILSMRKMFAEKGKQWGFDSNPDLMNYHTKIYRSANFDEDLFRSNYIRFHEEVHHWFSKQNNLMTINLWECSEPWAMLCDKLELDRPGIKFPHIKDDNGAFFIDLKYKVLQKYQRLLKLF
jgi:hypothetical protein